MGSKQKTTNNQTQTQHSLLEDQQPVAFPRNTLFRVFARAAAPVAIIDTLKQCIALIKLMPVLAMRLSRTYTRSILAPSYIFTMRDRLHVSRVTALGPSAEMIQLQSFRNISNEHEIGQAVREQLTKHAVGASGQQGALPVPTRTVIIEVGSRQLDAAKDCGQQFLIDRSSVRIWVGHFTSTIGNLFRSALASLALGRIGFIVANGRGV